jgi:hypothetical protein
LVDLVKLILNALNLLPGGLALLAVQLLRRRPG